jgi:signal transduction histidine kinase
VLDLDVTSARPVCVDPLQVQQALTNLVMNAVQAVPRGGHVGIVVDRIRSSLPPDHSGLWLNPPPEGVGSTGECICLRVVDDGPGIEEGARLRVFEPFYTTKDVGEGTGLGLAVAHGLVRENGGWITVDSELGHGTCFSMYFPATEGPN